MGFLVVGKKTHRRESEQVIRWASFTFLLVGKEAYGCKIVNKKAHGRESEQVRLFGGLHLRSCWLVRRRRGVKLSMLGFGLLGGHGCKIEHVRIWASWWSVRRRTDVIVNR